MSHFIFQQIIESRKLRQQQNPKSRQSDTGELPDPNLFFAFSVGFILIAVAIVEVSV